MKHQKAAITVEEGVEQLSISRTQLYRLIRSGQLRTVRAGRRILIPTSAIDEFLNGPKTP